MTKPLKDYKQPDKNGYFGKYGGQYVSELIIPLLESIDLAYEEAKKDPIFQEELKYYYKHYTGRPSPLYEAKRLTKHLGGSKIYFKRDELNHTGAHKINHCIGQVLLAKRMGKKHIIAETGAGQHGVATATVCALFDIPCTIYMGSKDMQRQEPNVFRMKLLGANIVSVDKGSCTLKEAMNEAMRAWVAHTEDCYYLIGTAAGPHPYPMMVRDFQSIIGQEAREQIIEYEGRLPNSLVACIGGGSNAIGLFYAFLEDEVEIIAVEAAGKGLDTKESAASINNGRYGVLHGNATYYLQDDDGQILDTHSISAGLDYPGIGPEHAYLNDIGRISYESSTDDEALEAFQLCAKLEGIIPALEPSHALAYVMRTAPKLPKDHITIMNLCGRGDKDIFSIASKIKL